MTDATTGMSDPATRVATVVLVLLVAGPAVVGAVTANETADTSAANETVDSSYTAETMAETTETATSAASTPPDDDAEMSGMEASAVSQGATEAVDSDRTPVGTDSQVETAAERTGVVAPAPAAASGQLDGGTSGSPGEDRLAGGASTDGPGLSGSSPASASLFGRLATDSGGATGAEDEGSGDGTPTPIPGVPPTGVALGVGALAAAAVVRQGTMASSTGLLGSTGTAIRAPGREILDHLLRLAVLLRYSRHDDSDPLEHETRAAVFEAMEDDPGIYLSEVGDRADIPLSTARHHIRVLEREDVVTSTKVHGKRRFYPDRVDGAVVRSALEQGPTEAILNALARTGPTTVTEIADEVGRDSSTITHHLQRLEDDGLVDRERDGQSVINRLAPQSRAALAERVDAVDVPASSATGSAD